MGKPCAGEGCSNTGLLSDDGVVDATKQPAPVSPNETVHAYCMQLLARFGAVAQSEEIDDCVAELGSGEGWCPEGEADEYRGCVRGCLETITITEDEYDSSDVSSSPMANCKGGCEQTTCGHGPP